MFWVEFSGGFEGFLMVFVVLWGFSGWFFWGVGFREESFSSLQLPSFNFGVLLLEETVMCSF